MPQSIATTSELSAMDTARALPTGTVTFLLSDVASSTQLWEGDATGAAAAIARHYELLDAAILRHGGVRPVEQGEGDSVVGAFATASDALAASVDIQLAFAREPWALAEPLRVRIALHTGEAQLRDEGNYFGPAIIRCARLRAVAHGGQILLSGATRDVVADRATAPITMRDLGSHRLKDLGRPERIWQACHPDLENDFPPLRSLNLLANNLPTELTTFIGRDAELAELREVLKERRLVTLTGAGGSGKTRLALHAAAEVVDKHRDGVWWVELASISHADLVPSTVATVLGLREEAGRPLTETLAEQLAGQGTLLVLDNCEHVLEACARLCECLLVAAPNVRIIATSREALGLPGETAWHVPPLDEETADRLFVERASYVRPNFAPTAAEHSVVSQICRRLDGIPLAIELAAAWTRMMHPSQIATALDDRFRLLTGGKRTAMPRQRTLEASVAWSHDLLDDGERALLRRLSVFAGGFTLDAAESVCHDDLVDRYAVLDLLSRLVDKSLVQVDHENTDARYRLLETIRYFARERLLDQGESDATRQRHLSYFVDLAELAEPEIVAANGPAWLAWLEQEHDNLRAALEWAETAHEDDLFLRLAAALTLFWELRGHMAEGGRWFARALAPEHEPSAARARALWGAAHVAVYGDDFGTAVLRIPEALAMAEAVDDQWARARALNTFGFLQAGSDPAAGRAALEKSISLGRAIGDDWAVADGLKMLGVTWIFQDDHDPALIALEQLHEVARGLDNKFFIAWYHCGVALGAVRRGDFDTARRELETSLEYCGEVGEPATAGIAIAQLAGIEVLTGHYADAVARLEAFLQRASASGGGLGVPLAVIELASLSLGQGNPTGASELVEPLVGQLRELGLSTWLSWSLSVLGASLIASGDAAGARAALDEARAVAGAPLHNPWLAALANHCLGQLARSDGDISQAEDLHHDSLVLRREHRFLPGVAQSLEALAGIAASQESRVEAARLYGAADSLRRSIGLVRLPTEQEDYDRDIAVVRSQLGDETFDNGWVEGTELSTEDAVTYASRARGERKRPSSGWDSLTPTEQRVVALAATGLTNPKIAEQMFISRGTVKVHLAHVFAKLSVSTRAELAAEATRRADKHTGSYERVSSTRRPR